MRTLMNAEQVSQYLGVKVSTIRKWTHYRYIPHIKIRGTVRFDRDEIDAWLNRQTNKGRASIRMQA